MASDDIRRITRDALEREVGQWSGETRWREPLLGFAAAGDPRFVELARRTEGGHSLPGDLLEGALSVASYFLPFDEGVVAANAADPTDVAREWAVAYLETNAILTSVGRAVVADLGRAGVEAVAVAPTGEFDRSTLTSTWSHKSVAVIAGLGTIGVNKMLITNSGCAGRLGSVVLGAAVEADERKHREMCAHLAGERCLRCVTLCPVGALRADGGIDRQRCWSRCRDAASLFSSLGKAQVCGKCAVGPCALTGGSDVISLVRMRATDDDAAKLQAVLDDAPSYSISITGQGPAPDAAWTLLRELPAGKTDDDKFVFGVRHQGRLIGCADVVRGYPEPGTAFIGLLILGERWQGKGLGRAACFSLEEVIGKWGCAKARLAVVEANANVFGFWTSMGFQRTGERMDYHCGAVDSSLVLMEKRLSEEAI